MEMTILEKLTKIQSELNAPKNQHNDFGKYNYRSCEDILQAVKPLLKENGCSLTLTDRIEYIGDRFYIAAKAQLWDNETGGSMSTEAFAREEESKKGMDGSQVTGTASSYARKYALNGLFAIDDNKDADTNEYRKQGEKAEPKKETATVTPKAETRTESPASVEEPKDDNEHCKMCGVQFASDKDKVAKKAKSGSIVFICQSCNDKLKAAKNADKQG